MKQHPEIGKNILNLIGSFSEISEWVLYHHERCDGKGYYGLPAESIPLPSQIIAVADTFSALTMGRSYRAPKSYEDSIAILKMCRGNQLNGELVNLFLSIPKEQVEHCRINKIIPIPMIR